MTDTELAIELSRIAHAHVEKGEMRHDVGLALLEAVKKWNRRAPEVPEGWKLVPTQPTPEMMQAGFDIPGSHLYGLTYRAMIAAAPQPPKDAE